MNPSHSDRNPTFTLLHRNNRLCSSPIVNNPTIRSFVTLLPPNKQVPAVHLSSSPVSFPGFNSILTSFCSPACHYSVETYQFCHLPNDQGFLDGTIIIHLCEVAFDPSKADCIKHSYYLLSFRCRTVVTSGK